MNTYKISLPNDYQSEIDQAEMDLSGMDYESLALIAKKSGLTYLRETDFGAEWLGTNDQFSNCYSELPAWAQPYASECKSYPIAREMVPATGN